MKNLLATALISLRKPEHLFRHLLSVLLIALLPGFAWAQSAAGVEVPRLQIATQGMDVPQSYRVLCYHDVRDNVRESFKVWPEATAVDTRDLIAQLSWLDQNGYHPVSLQQIIDARAGKKPLPEKAILLTFDDGFESMYTKVFPMLKQFGFPALIAIVGDWIQTPQDQPVQFGDIKAPRQAFVNWDQVREMQASGLIEVASHSHSLHKGIIGNPQGNMMPAAITRFYWPQNKQYESDEAYTKRIRADLERSASLIEKETGKRPRAMVWPYGANSRIANKIAAEVGMPISLNLEPGPNTPNDDPNYIRRTLVVFDTELNGMAEILRQPATYDGVERPMERVIHIDLDYIYDPDPEVQEANLSKLLDRIVRLRPTTVYLQAYADPDGDGVADALYFPNRHMPVRADLFTRVSWQLRTRGGVRVFAWMPVMAFKLPDTHPAATHLVQTMPGAPESASQNRYLRLSPFDPLARQTITEIYEDLGKHSAFYGVLFHDDATLSDYEDASPAALAVYRDQWQLSASMEELRKDPQLRRLWSQKKTAYLNEFTLHLAATLRQYQPALMTARNIYAEPILNPDSEDWFAQTYPSFLATYDYTAIMAMPYMEGAKDATAWLAHLMDTVKKTPGALRTTVFELQSKDWRTGQPIPSKTLAAQIRQLRLAGARGVGYYPDDFHANQPEEDIIKPEISVETHPARR
ncbi:MULTISPECIES: poly-beta-1,6-N-acetyl-D-glucosamine N-deacetylase PgaB [Oxalobacteraceae]|uniref:poly-beta-1,6-N-acetyl-D-glucosamine N-deacetylase PgaB n=1 Tax=Herminiimonas sp. Marseille-P9896 TaxID=2742211 RepID=UPI0020CA4E4D|nr:MULTISPECIES: poly-beta-1,6-N-acetyl-D-glucosamine N-deacetylase PgaB [Oxalobacteraceae]